MTNEDAPWKNEELLRQKYTVEGKTQAEIGEELGCAGRTVSKYLREYGISTRSKNDYTAGPWRDKETLQELYVERTLSTHEIAEKLGCDATAVQRWLKKHDIGTRSEGSGLDRDAPWKDKDTLREMYVGEKMSTYEIANYFGVSDGTIGMWLDRHGISRRYNSPHFKTREDGYEVVRHQVEGDTHIIRVHRLLAYAEGLITAEELFDKDIHVHHQTNIPWDNRPNKLKGMTNSEHIKMHHSDDFSPSKS